MNYKPFPLLKYFHILDCDTSQDGFPSIRKAFTGLKEFSLLRSTSETNERSSHITYSDLTVNHPNIQHLKIDHLNVDPIDFYNVISKLKYLTSLDLELLEEFDSIIIRYRIELTEMLSRLPSLKK